MTNSPMPPEPTDEAQIADHAQLAKARQQIKNAWIAGLISGGLTLALTLVAVSNSEAAQRFGINAWNFVDVVLIFGLAFGIYLKNRVCAVIMLVYFVASKIFQFSQGTINPAGIGIAALFIYYFFEGVRGTFTHHRLASAHKEAQ